MDKDEIHFTEKAIQKWISKFKKTCLLAKNNPKLVRVSFIFRDDDGEIEERVFSVKTFNYERDMQY